jgi:Uncharacterized conserved protein (DUF2303)
LKGLTVTEEPQNILQTALDCLPLGEVSDILQNGAPNQPVAHVVVIPENMKEVDLTDRLDKLATKLQPWRRSGTAQLADLDSLIGWANRHKGPASALFADPVKPSLTCIADYQNGGAPVMDATTRDPAASHNRHRAVYEFPLSAEWKIWTGISGKALSRSDLGEFVEANAKDMLDPSDALREGRMVQMEDWEKAMHRVAGQVQGRFGAPATLIALSRRFVVDEKSTLSATRNPDTGEASFQFINEHQTPDGQPVKIPNLFLLALPVFDHGALYRLAARFRYVKSGSDIKFYLTLHNPDIARRDALDLALGRAAEETALPLFLGAPES